MAFLGRSVHDLMIRVQSIRTNVFITADPGAIPAEIRNPGVTSILSDPSSPSKARHHSPTE